MGLNDIFGSFRQVSDVIENAAECVFKSVGIKVDIEMKAKSPVTTFIPKPAIPQGTSLFNGEIGTCLPKTRRFNIPMVPITRTSL